MLLPEHLEGSSKSQLANFPYKAVQKIHASSASEAVGEEAPEAVGEAPGSSILSARSVDRIASARSQALQSSLDGCLQGVELEQVIRACEH